MMKKIQQKYQKKILASVIIVNFNNAKYLTDSLKSVFNQSYKHKEVIVVDDFSTDNSIEVLKKFKKKIKLIKDELGDDKSKMEKKIEDFRNKEVKSILFDKYLNEISNDKNNIQTLNKYFTRSS